MPRVVTIGWVAALGTLTLLSPLVAQDVVKLGAGSYATQAPPGTKGPPAEVFKTDNVRGPIPTTDWWTSLAWTKYSEPQFAHPLAVRAAAGGLQVYYPGASLGVNKVGIMGGMPGGGRDLVLGHSAADTFPDARLHAFSDWFVTASFAPAPAPGSSAVGAARMLVSYGHGSPFVYALYEGGAPKLTFADTPQVWSGGAEAAVLGVTVSGRHYALFAPTGSTWSGLGTRTLTCDTEGKTYFALAILPDKTEATLALFRGHAYSHVTDTKVAWSFDEKTSVVATTFSFTTKAHEGAETGTLFALYPHQWRHTSVETLGRYDSVRGVMKLTKGNSFTTRMTFPGLLPALPLGESADVAKLRQFVAEEAAAPRPAVKDTYWEGKWLGRLACVAPIAEQLGDEASARKLRDTLRQRLELWLGAGASQASGGQPQPPPPTRKTGLFAYNRTWGTLIGYPASYGSDDQLNDHHFHYGYFLKAAAEVARHDPAWAGQDRFGPMLRLIVRDIACPTRDDPMFPFLRSFDPYAGHSWASGHARFGDGNNQESSSESMNAWGALILLGQFTGDKDLRDLGAYLYTTELAGIEEYWFDVRAQNRPPAYTPSVVTMVWGGKSVNETWFSNKPEIVHGINFLPMHGGSLYLGRFPQYVRRNYEALAREKGSTAWTDWIDTIWMYRALDDAKDALAQYDAAAKVAPEAGNSRANLYHWLHGLSALGQVDRVPTADYPLAVAFMRGDERRYVAYNNDAQPRTVRFSDGMALTVPPRSLAVSKRNLPWRSVFDGKTLEGWKPLGSAAWRVEEGVIVGGQDGDARRSGLLTSKDSFQDFELELEFSIDEHGKYNSGVYLRNQLGAGGRTGYQVNIGRGAAGEYSAGVFTDKWLAKGDEDDTIRRKLEWNQLRIAAHGPRLVVDLNGVNVVDYTDPNPPAKVLAPGVLGFQTYGAEGHAGWIKFRNLRLRELK